MFLSIVGYWLRASRFYLYGLLLFLAGVVHQWGGVALWGTVAVAGTVMLIIGSLVLFRFLRDNPIAGETLDE
ncbi:MAG: hypothetical protein E4G93_06360 [Dehalococcoidia bacterium]|nr:MAG: hypothetical protein E4G93_06360 [Dehalococcoidia bacterium]